MPSLRDIRVRRLDYSGVCAGETSIYVDAPTLKLVSADGEPGDGVRRDLGNPTDDEVERARVDVVYLLARLGCVAASYAINCCDPPLPEVGAYGMGDVDRINEPDLDEPDEYDPHRVGVVLHVRTADAKKWLRLIRQWLQVLTAESGAP